MIINFTVPANYYLKIDDVYFIFTPTLNLQKMLRAIATRKKQTSEPPSKKAVDKKPKATKKTFKPKKNPKPLKQDPKKDPRKATKVVKRRKINEEPTLSNKAGLNISVARVKSIVDRGVLNRELSQAFDELTRVPRSLKEELESKGVPTWDDMSQDTKNVVARAQEQYFESQRREFERESMKKMSAEELKAYNATKKEAKSSHEQGVNASFNDDVDEGFDLFAFNKSYSKNFYKDFTPKLPELSAPKERETATKTVTKRKKNKEGKWEEVLEEQYIPLSPDPELKRFADIVSKLKIRFSANVKILLSAFVELLVHQLAVNGTYSCIMDKKKIIKVANIIDPKHAGVEERLPLNALIANLNTYKYYVQRVEARLAAEASGEEYDEDDAGDGQYSCNFNIYVGEIFRNARLQLSRGEIDVGKVSKENREMFAQTSLSKGLKVFCSNVIIELLERVAMMLNTEVTSHGVKTVTAPMVRTVIKHIHDVCGADYEASRSFMREAATKYVHFTEDRRVQKKNSHEEETPDYEEDE